MKFYWGLGTRRQIPFKKAISKSPATMSVKWQEDGMLLQHLDSQHIMQELTDFSKAYFQVQQKTIQVKFRNTVTC